MRLEWNQSLSLLLTAVVCVGIGGLGCADEDAGDQSVDASPLDEGDGEPVTPAGPDAVTDSVEQQPGAEPVEPSVDVVEPADAADSSEPLFPPQPVPEPLPAPKEEDCDPIHPAQCAMPWPSNLYLEPDESRATGYTLRFGETSLIQNKDGLFVKPEQFARLDGYGPSTSAVVLFPGIDLSGMPTEWTTDDSLGDDSPVVWMKLDEAGAERVPCWAELDLNGNVPEDQALHIRPAAILEEGARYVIAFRGLKTTDGAMIEPSDAFAKLRDGETGDEPLLAPRQARFDEIFAALEAEGIERGELTLAWDFVTASSDSLHGAMLHMRDKAFEIVGEMGPELTLTEVVEKTPEEDEYIALEIKGTFRVPDFTKQVANLLDGPAWVLNLDEDGVPQQNGWSDADMWIQVPRSALSGEPHGLVQYGHGQNGHGDQVKGGFNSKIAHDHKLIFFACDMLGMSNPDVGNIVQFIADFSYFTWLSDRLHQGMLNHLLLARAMRERFDGMEPISDQGVVVNKDELFYSGISQGGIYGATYMALSTDVSRGHLGVPGNNYSMLLYRSQNFKPFFETLKLWYYGAAQRAVGMQMVQQLWNMIDSVSYYRHITHEPFAGNEPHQVLVVPAKGDYQVAVVTNEIVARSGIGVPLLENYDDEREVQGAEMVSYPHQGSGVVLYDFGNPWPAHSVPLPPEEDELGDPHGLPRHLDVHNEQMVHFFRTGEIIDVCGGDGCHPE